MLVPKMLFCQETQKLQNAAKILLESYMTANPTGDAKLKWRMIENYHLSYRGEPDRIKFRQLAQTLGTVLQ